MVEHGAVAFGNRFELGQKIGELFGVPAGDVAEHALAVGAIGAGGFAVGMRVVVVPRRGQTEPGEAGEALTLGQHVGRDAGLPRHQRLGQQVALQLGDARPVLHVAVVVGRIDAAVLGGQSGDGALHIANRRKVLFHAHGIVLGNFFLQVRGILPHGVEDAALAGHPAGIARAEQVIEELVRQHLRRQRAIVSGPAHVALDALAEGFLRDADLNRAEARIAADFGGDGLVDGCSARAVAGERRTGGDAADRLVVAVAGAGGIGRLVVQAAENVDIVAERRQRTEARREVKVGTGLAGNPIPLGDAVAVEPEDEAALDRFRRTPSAAYAVPVELNMLTSGGSPTCTALPASVSP